MGTEKKELSKMNMKGLHYPSRKERETLPKIIIQPGDLVFFKNNKDEIFCSIVLETNKGKIVSVQGTYFALKEWDNEALIDQDPKIYDFIIYDSKKKRFMLDRSQY